MFNDFTEREMQEFSNIVNKLLFKKYILEYIYSRKDRKLVLNPDYRFIYTHTREIREYLEPIGWELIEDRNNGVYYIENPEITYHISLDKFTTITLLLLRIIYEKKQEEVSLESGIYFTLQEVLDEGNIVGVIEDVPKIGVRKNAMKTLRKHGIISKIHGEYEDKDSAYVLHPTILHVVNSQNTKSILDDFADVEEKDNFQYELDKLEGDSEEESIYEEGEDFNENY